MSRDAFANYAAMGGFTIDGTSYVSGVDPAKWGSQKIYNDATSLPDGFAYYNTIRERIALAAGFGNDPNINGGKNNLPDFTVKPETPDETAESERIDKLLRAGVPFGDAIKAAGTQLKSVAIDTLATQGINLIIIVVAIALLAVAAYSVIVPQSTRSQIASLAITKGFK